MSVTLHGMAAEHSWEDCRPAILTTTGGNPIQGDLLQAAIERLWFRFPEADRQAFHRFCCLNSRSISDLAAMQRIAAALQREAGVR